MERDLPLFIVASIVSAYWSCVFLMAGRSWVKFRGPAGVIPKTRWERWMWLVWVPNTAAWVALPWSAGNSALDTAAGQAGAGLWLVLARWLLALLAVVAFGLTVRCWLAMGSSWTMAVNPKKKTVLITDGAFSVVRHPIYALSLLLMTCTVATVASLPMLLVGGIHFAMIFAKTASEERFLLSIHGEAYRQYCRRTNRYVPLCH